MIFDSEWIEKYLEFTMNFISFKLFFNLGNDFSKPRKPVNVSSLLTRFTEIKSDLINAHEMCNFSTFLIVFFFLYIYTEISFTMTCYIYAKYNIIESNIYIAVCILYQNRLIERNENNILCIVFI